MLDQITEHQVIPSNVLWADEETFTRNRINNTRNECLWTLENPHAIRQRRDQRRTSTNGWAEILYSEISEIEILENHLNGNNLFSL